jgi:thiamine biosynthesis protein ThiI
MVPLLPIQERIVADCPARFRVLLYRRFMMRLSRQVAASRRCKALVTGESLGQVASQTIENLAAVESVLDMPVLRPLISLDKQEIITIGRRAGTYEISIRPHFDCCSFLVPEHPATRANPADLDRAERNLDIEALVAEAVRDCEIVAVDSPASWSEIPTPFADGSAP